ncbi:MAG: hypothetical protein WDN24_01965 [Sphingomonas sp.]
MQKARHASRLRQYGHPPSSRPCRRARRETGAINLGQGFSDGRGPEAVLRGRGERPAREIEPVSADVRV